MTMFDLEIRPANNKVGDLHHVNDDNTLRGIEAKQDEVDDRRLVEVEALVRGRGADLDLSWRLLFRPLGAMLIAVCWVSVGLSAIPYHDVMVEVQYWWENTVLQHGLVFFHMSAIFLLTVTSSFLNIDCGFTWKNWIFTWIFGFITAIIFNVLAQVAWVYILRLRYPAPFIGLINLFFGLGSQVFVLWFQLPLEWRANACFRSRAKWVVGLHLYSLAVSSFYILAWIVFTLLPLDLQPILAVMLPISREGIGYLLNIIGDLLESKLLSFHNSGKKSAGKDVPSVELLGQHMVSQFHVLFVAVCVGSVATSTTTYLLLGIDFLINLQSCRKVWRSHRRGDHQKCGKELMTLTMNEFLEFIVPICYLICYVVAFYGPNSHLIGNILKNNS